MNLNDNLSTIRYYVDNNKRGFVKHMLCWVTARPEESRSQFSSQNERLAHNDGTLSMNEWTVTVGRSMELTKTSSPHTHVSTCCNTRKQTLCGVALRGCEWPCLGDKHVRCRTNKVGRLCYCRDVLSEWPNASKERPRPSALLLQASATSKRLLDNCIRGNRHLSKVSRVDPAQVLQIWFIRLCVYAISCCVAYLSTFSTKMLPGYEQSWGSFGTKYVKRLKPYGK